MCGIKSGPVILPVIFLCIRSEQYQNWFEPRCGLLELGWIQIC